MGRDGVVEEKAAVVAVAVLAVELGASAGGAGGEVPEGVVFGGGGLEEDLAVVEPLAPGEIEAVVLAEAAGAEDGAGMRTDKEDDQNGGESRGGGAVGGRGDSRGEERGPATSPPPFGFRDSTQQSASLSEEGL